MSDGKARRTIIIALAMAVLCALPLFASTLEFSGGHTTVTTQNGSKRVVLSGGAKVATDKITLSSDSIELYGDNYSYVLCSGNVKADETENKISFSSPNLFYDRNSGRVYSDSWIEIQDTENQAALSGGWFEYDMNSSSVKLQLMAKIIKVTDEGLMVCRADSIEYNGKEDTVTLRGNASVEWNDDSYKAAMIVVDLSTNDIRMYGTISGAFNG